MNRIKSLLFKESFLILSALFIFLPFSAQNLFSQNLDVPYVPTPNNVVEKMLDVADVKESDYVIDLGSGDGRIVIAAAKRGAVGHGVDLDPERISEARTNAAEAGVEDKVLFKKQNIFETDFSNASVITMYLLSSVNLKLRPHLLENLKPGTRIVSHSFDMNEWEPDKEIEVNGSSGRSSHKIYYWVIPAKVEGRWTWNQANTTFNMDIKQTFQEIEVDLSDTDGSNYHIKSATLHGDRINIEAVNGENLFIYNGQIEKNKIEGILQYHKQDKKDIATWNAQKK